MTIATSPQYLQEDNSSIPGLGGELSSNSNPGSINDLVIDSAEVLEQLFGIDVSKCGGPDGIPVILLKEGAQAISHILTRILNYSLEVGSLPIDWTI